MTTTLLERPSPAGTADARDGDATFVTLTVADQLCGIPVLGVRDVLGEQTITRIPLASPEIAGSLNLRGRIVTAIDLRRRLGLGDAAAATATERMSVVVELAGELYALLVDQVSEVMTLPTNAFEHNPPTLPPQWSEFSVGIYRLQDRLLVVLDVARLLSIGPLSRGRA
jgi:purine-binding chemotaxis protein CheW